jgi:hypothetical protein
MTAANRDGATRIARALLATGVVLLVAQSLADLVASLGFHSYHSVVDLDRNNGVPDVVSTVAIISAALGAIAMSIRAQHGRLRLALLALVLTLIALADAFQAEVDRSTRSGQAVLATIALAALLLLSASLEMPRWARVSTLVGLGSLAVAASGAVAYDAILNPTGLGDLGRGDVIYELGIVGKQGLELAGWILVAVGLWAAASDAAAQPRTERSPARLQSH